ncbi:MAG: hypothetical protein ACK5Y2_07685 [Bdellovibrionales bacterium]
MKLKILVPLAWALMSIVACGDQFQKPGVPNAEDGTDGTGSLDKPTQEEKQEFAQATRLGVNVSHRNLQLVSVNPRSVSVKALVNVGGLERTLQLSPAELQTGGIARFRQVLGTTGDKILDIYLYRDRRDSAGVEQMGVEYRMSRTQNGEIVSASQFLRVRLDRLNSPQVVTRQRFEFPSRTDLERWTSF